MANDNMADTDRTILTTVAEALLAQAGYVPLLWHTDDVRAVIEDREISVTLTNAECLQVLRNALENHEATIGTSWDVIEAELESFAKRRAEEASSVEMIVA